MNNVVAFMGGAIAGGLASTVALAMCNASGKASRAEEGLCWNASKHAGIFRCARCGAEWNTEEGLIEPTLWVDGIGDMPSYCQNCGRRIVWRED